MCSATVKKKINTDFSSSNQNSVRWDPTEKNDVSQSKATIGENTSSWVTAEMQQEEQIIRGTAFRAQKV